MALRGCQVLSCMSKQSTPLWLTVQWLSGPTLCQCLAFCKIVAKCTSLAACERGWAKCMLPHINLEIRHCNLLQNELLLLCGWTFYAVMTCWRVWTVKLDKEKWKIETRRVGLGVSWEQNSSWTKRRWIGCESIVLEEKLGWLSKEKLVGEVGW